MDVARSTMLAEQLLNGVAPNRKIGVVAVGFVGQDGYTEYWGAIIGENCSADQVIDAVASTCAASQEQASQAADSIVDQSGGKIHKHQILLDILTRQLRMAEGGSDSSHKFIVDGKKGGVR